MTAISPLTPTLTASLFEVKPLSTEEKVEKLGAIQKQIAQCKKCPLYQGTLNPVFGEGNPDAAFIFIGEAPGASEDSTGHPFVGRSGKLLTLALEKLGYKREDTWIGNIIKHRPPDNRDPLPEEISVCKGYLEAQLKIIQPKLVVTLGRFAMNYFYPEGKISRDHGKVFLSGGYKVYPMFHPAAALRNPSMMLEFKKDFINLPKVLKDL